MLSSMQFPVYYHLKRSLSRPGLQYSALQRKSISNILQTLRSAPAEAQTVFSSHLTISQGQQPQWNWNPPWRRESTLERSLKQLLPLLPLSGCLLPEIGWGMINIHTDYLTLPPLYSGSLPQKQVGRNKKHPDQTKNSRSLLRYSEAKN